MNTLIIPDLHGSIYAFTDLLLRAGVMDKSGARLRGWHVIQVGDLCNMAPEGQPFRGFYSYDVACIELAKTFIDEQLVGNHEVFFTHGRPVGQWNGMAPTIKGTLRERALNELKWKAATVVNGTLITHAGFNRETAARFLDNEPDPNVVAKELNKALLFGEPLPAIDSVDGMLWLRPHNRIDKRAPWPQIVGHTPIPGAPVHNLKLNTYFIDGGDYLDGAVKGLLLKKGEELWATV